MSSRWARPDPRPDPRLTPRPNPKPKPLPEPEPGRARAGARSSNPHQVGGLCVAGEYAELAKRFVGHVPPERPETLLGVSAKQRPEVPQIPLCPLPQAEIEELLKARLRYCDFGPRAKGYAGPRAPGATLMVPGYWPKRKQA